MAGIKKSNMNFEYTYKNNLKKYAYILQAKMTMENGDRPTLHEVAEKISEGTGLKKNTIVKYIHHPEDSFTLGTAMNLAQFFGVPVEEIITLIIVRKNDNGEEILRKDVNGNIIK